MITLRQAAAADSPALALLIDTSVREPQSGDYTPDQIDSSLRAIYGVSI